MKPTGRRVIGRTVNPVAGREGLEKEKIPRVGKPFLAKERFHFQNSVDGGAL